MNGRVRLTRSTSTYTLGVVATLEETVDTTDGELKTCSRRPGLGFGCGVTSSLAGLGLSADFSRHCDEM